MVTDSPPAHGSLPVVSERQLFPEHRPTDVAVLTLNVTWACPVRCPYCYRIRQFSRTDKAVLARADLARECRLAAQCGIEEFRFSGGEPLVLGDKLFEYADIVFDITGKKPVVLTSGLGLNERWLRKAINRFSSIAISIENPLDPIQRTVRTEPLLRLMRECSSPETPLRYGLSLVEASHFYHVDEVFEILYENVNRQHMPQLDYPCLGNFVQPSAAQLRDLVAATERLFRRYSAIPYYFVYLIGSLVWLERGIDRIVLNLHPDGKYQIYDSLIERWRLEYRWLEHIREQQHKSEACRRCDWRAVCRHHPYWALRYDWCELRSALFEGIYRALLSDSRESAKTAAR